MVERLCGTSESTDVRNNALQMLREAIGPVRLAARHVQCTERVRRVQVGGRASPLLAPRPIAAQRIAAAQLAQRIATAQLAQRIAAAQLNVRRVKRRLLLRT